MAAVAFFDFDETLVASKSMFTFLEFFCSLKPRKTKFEYHSAMAIIHQMVSAGATREAVNSYYYSLFDGISVASVQLASLQMWSTRLIPFLDKPLNCLNRHRLRGDDIVVVSGSMHDIIKPVLEHAGVKHSLCSEPVIQNGKYSGVLRQQAIGTGKAALVKLYCERTGANPEQCYAYGDHITDLPMLSVVGHPTIVNPDKHLQDVARSHGWSTLTSTASTVNLASA